MTNPRRYLTRMIVFLVIALGVVGSLWSPIANAFVSNSALNGLIIGVLLLGVAYCCLQVITLNREVSWIETFRTGRPGMSVQARPRLLAPMAAMLGDRKDTIRLSALSMRSMLDGISARLDESREISRYLIGLLIFLGLLGTFWGLLHTITAVADVISDLSIAGGGSANDVFSHLKAGLQAPLSGMGTAFSSSLFGLAGSLVLGFLDLQAGQAQNRFYNDLEDWLSGQARLSSGGLGGGDGEQSVPAYVQALLEQTADNLESLERTLAKGEDARIAANNNMTALTDKLTALTDQMRTEQTLMMRLAESQLELKPIMSRLADAGATSGEEMREHVRNLDIQMSRLLEELAAGRQEMVHEIRSELRVLSRTIAAVAEQAKQ